MDSSFVCSELFLSPQQPQPLSPWWNAPNCETLSDCHVSLADCWFCLWFYERNRSNQFEFRVGNLNCVNLQCEPLCKLLHWITNAHMLPSWYFSSHFVSMRVSQPTKTEIKIARHVCLTHSHRCVNVCVRFWHSGTFVKRSCRVTWIVHINCECHLTFQTQRNHFVQFIMQSGFCCEAY